MIPLPNKHCSGHYKATKEKGNQGTRTLGEKIWSQKRGQQAGGRQTWQLKAEVDGKSGLWPVYHWQRQNINQVFQHSVSLMSPSTY